MKQPFYFLILFLVISTFTYSQNTPPEFKYNVIAEKDCDIRCFISTKMENLGSKYFANEMYNSFSSFQFNIDTSGFIINLNANEHTTFFLFNLIDSILKLTNGKWTPQYSDGKKVKSKSIILPVIYFWGSNTDSKNTANNFFSLDYFVYSTSNLFTPNNKINYLEKPKYLTKSRVTKEKEINIGFMDCFLLNPIYIQPKIII
jgi:hypothetical protein